MFLLAAQEVVNADTVLPDESTPLSHLGVAVGAPG